MVGCISKLLVVSSGCKAFLWVCCLLHHTRPWSLCPLLRFCCSTKSLLKTVIAKPGHNLPKEEQLLQQENVRPVIGRHTYLLGVWKQECNPTRNGWLDATSKTCFSVCTQSMSWQRKEKQPTLLVVQENKGADPENERCTSVCRSPDRKEEEQCLQMAKCCVTFQSKNLGKAKKS